MLTREKLIQAIEDYLRKTGMSARAFGKAVINDQNLVYHLRAGTRSVTLATVERIDTYMRDNPPPAIKKKRAAVESRSAA